MSHLEDVTARVDATIAESVIAHMNELLIELSEDSELTREDRYTQQRLRNAIAHHGNQFNEAAAAGHDSVTDGGALLCFSPGCCRPARRQPPAAPRRIPGRSGP